MKTDKNATRRWSVGTATTAVFFAVSLLSVGAIAAVLLTATPVPDSLKEADPASIAVVEEPFKDPRQLAATLELGAAQVVRAPRGATVTAINCVPSQSWQSGESNVALDGQPLVNIHTPSPPWRDITPGDSGNDIIEMRAALAALGYAAGEGDSADVALFSAMREARAAIGATFNPNDTPQIELGQFVWLPPQEFSPLSCDVGLGDTVTPGAPLASSAGKVTVGLPKPPVEAIQGKRHLTLLGITSPLDSEWRLTEPQVFASVADSVIPAGGDNLTAVAELVEAVPAWVVPTSSIIEGETSAPCVIDEHGSHWAATILGSEFGRVYVSFQRNSGSEQSDTHPKRVRVSPPVSTKCRSEIDTAAKSSGNSEGNKDDH